MLHFAVVRVGLITTFLWDRYGPAWLKALAAAGAHVETVAGRDAGAWRHDPRVKRGSSSVFELVAAEAVALSHCDRLLVPSVNEGYDGTKGSASDPFVADLPSALQHAVPGIPKVWRVATNPATPGFEANALAILAEVAGQPASARRVWQTHKSELHQMHTPHARAATPPGDAWVGVLGQPWWMDEPYLAAGFASGDERYLMPAVWPAEDLRNEGWTLDSMLAPSDAEAVGAARRMARMHRVKRLILTVDPQSSADAWLERTVRRMARKPLEVVEPVDPFDTTEGRWVEVSP